MSSSNAVKCIQPQGSINQGHPWLSLERCLVVPQLYRTCHLLIRLPRNTVVYQSTGSHKQLATALHGQFHPYANSSHTSMHVLLDPCVHSVVQPITDIRLLSRPSPGRVPNPKQSQVPAQTVHKAVKPQPFHRLAQQVEVAMRHILQTHTCDKSGW